MRLAFGRGRYGVDLTIVDLSFKDFADLCKTPSKGGKYGKYFIRGGRLTKTRGIHKRNNKSLRGSAVIIIDGDSRITKSAIVRDGAPSAKSAHKALRACGLTHFVYTTHSHSKDQNKWRAVIPCKISHNTLERNQSALKATYQHVINLLNEKGCNVALAGEGLVWSQAWYLPSRDDPSDGQYEFYQWHKGRPLNGLPPNHAAPAAVIGKSTAMPDTVEELVEQIQSGEHLYTPLRKLIWMLVKDGVAAEVIRQLFNSYLHISPLKNSDRKRWEAARSQIDNLIDGAQKKTKPKQAKTAKLKKPKQAEAPRYPSGCVTRWPEPFPTLFKEFRALSYDPNDLLLHPTFTTFHSYLLQGKFRTLRGRRPNMLNLTLAASTGGKDTNSGDVLEQVCLDINGTEKEHVLKKAKLFPYGVKVHGITGDTAFLETVTDEDREGNFMWTNTEATSIFEQLRNAEGFNSHVGALQDILNEISDGRELSFKKKAGHIVKGHANPNVHCNFYAQIDTVFKNVTAKMLQGGMLGRNDVLIDYSPVELKPTIEVYRKHENLSASTVKFYRFALKELASLPPKRIKLTARATEKFKKWEQKHVIEQGKDKSNETKLLWGRVVQSGEKLIAVLFGWQVLWARFCKKDVPRAFDAIECVFPYLEYQLQVREHMIKCEMASASVAIEDAIIEFVSTAMVHPTKEYERFAQHGMVPKSAVWKNLRTHTSLQAKVMGDYRSAVLGIIESMVKEGSLVQELPPIDKCRTLCLRLPE